MIDQGFYRLKKSVYDDIIGTLSSDIPEKGGIIGCDSQGIICAFHYDKNPAQSTVSSYCPNVDYLNEIINSTWLDKGIMFAGFVHTHLNNTQISQEDTEYAKKLLGCLNQQYVLMGIVGLNRDGSLNELAWYNISKDECVCTEMRIF